MSNNTNEYTKSGQPIYRHQQKNDFQTPHNLNSSSEEIIKHFEKHIGQVATTFHEAISDQVHIDVHFIYPSPERDYYTLFTTGMSDLRMTVPEGAEDYRYAELMLCLPKDWQLSQDAFKSEKNYWPVRWLKQLARLPHEYNTWLGVGHTVPNGETARPFSNNTKFCCMVIAAPTIVDDFEEFCRLEINDYKTVNFYSALPLYKEEMNFKLDHDVEELFGRFDENGINEIIDINRINVCKKKKRFIFF